LHHVLTQAERQQRAIRLRRFAIVESIKRASIVAAVLLGLALVLWWQRGKPVDPIRERAIASLCQSGYESARSAADTTAVDQEQPVVGKLTALARISCGELRRSGKTHR